MGLRRRKAKAWMRPSGRRQEKMSTRTKADTVERLRELLSPEHREELLREMTPENRALYERIRKRREEIGLIGFDIVEAIREIREDG